MSDGALVKYFVMQSRRGWDAVGVRCQKTFVAKLRDRRHSDCSKDMLRLTQFGEGVNRGLLMFHILTGDVHGGREISTAAKKGRSLTGDYSSKLNGSAPQSDWHRRRAAKFCNLLGKRTHKSRANKALQKWVRRSEPSGKGLPAAEARQAGSAPKLKTAQARSRQAQCSLPLPFGHHLAAWYAVSFVTSLTLPLGRR